MRMRFNTAEKNLIASGAPIEVRTGRYWHPARVFNTVIHRDHAIEHVVTIVTAGKYKDQLWHTSPTALRAAHSAATPEG